MPPLPLPTLHATTPAGNPLSDSAPCRLIHAPQPGIRQTLILGVPAPSGRGFGLTEFELLIQTEDGHLIWLQVRDRDLPDLSQLMQLAELASDRYATLERPSSPEFDDELTERFGFCVRMRDDCLDDFVGHGLSSIVARTLLLRIAKESPADRNQIRQQLVDQLNEAFSNFIGSFEPELMTLAQQGGTLRPSLINFFIGPSGRVGLYRRQATTAMPLLLQRLCSHQDKKSRATMSAIDMGRPLFAAISETWGAPRSAVKVLADLQPDWLAESIRPDFDLLMRVVSDIDHNFRPQGQEEWQKLGKALAMISSLSKRSLLASSNRVWIGSIARLGYPVPSAEDTAATASGRLIDDLLSAVELALRSELQQGSNNKHCIEEAAKGSQHLASSLSIPRLVELARRFNHSRRQEEMAFAEEIEALASGHWPSPLQAELDVGDLMVCSLRSQKELEAEGRAMGNCVAGYGVECLRGRCQIFSIRQKDGRRASTLETKISRNTNGTYLCQVVQHHSAGNGRPAKAAVDAAAHLLKVIAQGGESIDRYWRWKTSIAGKSRKEREMEAFITPKLRALNTVLPKHLGLVPLLEHIRKISSEADAF